VESVYLETTVISYLVARRSRDLIVAAHQQITVEWWDDHRSRFDCFISQVVWDEASAGDPVEVKKRQKLISTIPLLKVTDEGMELAREILANGAIPLSAARDAAHIAVCAVNNIDFLLTWNCKHLANAQIERRIQKICAANNLRTPIICTPSGLMGE
jgi:hypothetical protein